MSQAFDTGQAVRVLRRDTVGHVRTPSYAQGKEGVVERVCGGFRNPETLAYGKDGLPRVTLYRVRFEQRTLWPEYDGPPNDCVDIEIYEHWLETAATANTSP